MKLSKFSKFSKRARAFMEARAKARRDSVMRIIVEKMPDGRITIESAYPGPMTTLEVLEEAVAAVKQIGRDQALQAARPSLAIPSLAIPTPEETRQLVGANGHQG